MATIPVKLEELDALKKNRLIVVHPLDDVPEEKIDIERLGPMPMTVSAKISLMSLRGYLILMFLLVMYHVADLAGLFSKHAH